MLTLKNMHRKKRLPFTTFFQSARAAFIGKFEIHVDTTYRLTDTNLSLDI